MDTDKLIENVALAMYALIKPEHDWNTAIIDDYETVSELRFRARCAVVGSRIINDPPRGGLDLSFKRAFVEGS